MSGRSGFARRSFVQAADVGHSPTYPLFVLCGLSIPFVGAVNDREFGVSEPAVFQRLCRALTDGGVAFVHTRHEPVFTSAEAAAVRGVSLHSGAKALILKAGDAMLLAVMPADLALNSAALRKHLGQRRLRFATKEEVKELTGLKPGSIPPFGSLFGLPTICDERLCENERINFNAGSHTDSFQIAYADYIAYERPAIAALAKSFEK